MLVLWTMSGKNYVLKINSCEQHVKKQLLNSLVEMFNFIDYSHSSWFERRGEPE